MSTQTTPSTPDPAASSSTAWRWIDRWVRDPKIRRDGLIALAMLLFTFVALALVGAILLAPLTAKILSGLAAGGLGVGGYRLLRRSRRRKR